MLSGSYQFRFHRYISGFIVFGILTIWNTCYLEYLLFGIPVIWNGCYLEYSHTLLVSPSFTGVTHYLYTTESSLYLDRSNNRMLFSTLTTAQLTRIKY